MVWVMGEYLCGEKTSLEERVKAMNGSRLWGWGKRGRRLYGSRVPFEYLTCAYSTFSKKILIARFYTSIQISGIS